ncbi:MAG: hypothetical protein ABI120_17385 [Gemmatimonadaceae bacterium]
MITSFKSTDKTESEKKEKGISYQAAEEMRDKVDGAFSPKQVYVVPVERINPNLVASQFSTTEGLEAHDAKQLAAMLRADEFVMGTVEKTATGYKVSADMVLTRDISARQPLGIGEAPKLGDAVKILVNEMKEARKQSDGEKKCTNAAREGKFPEAIAFANAAIAAYPKATLARMCLISVLRVSKAPSTEIARVARELTTLDQRNNFALGFLADVYRERQESDSLVMVLTRMLQNDPKNADMVGKIVTEIADAKNPAIARPIIDSAVVLNPGDPELLKLRWQILSAVKDFKAMYAQGEELVRLDTSFADTLYFQRTSVAYAADSNFQKASETAAKGAAKFPTNGFLAGYEIQMLQKAGQLQPALDKLRKARAAKINIPNGGTTELLILDEMNTSPAEIIVAARALIAAGDTSSNIPIVIIGQANKMFSAGQAEMKTDAAAAQTTFGNALSALAYADTVAAKEQKPQIAFLRGATSVLLASLLAQQAQPAKSCELTNRAKAAVTEAMINLPQGGAYAPKATMDQLMGMAMQLDTNLGQMAAAYKCK